MGVDTYRRPFSIGFINPRLDRTLNNEFYHESKHVGFLEFADEIDDWEVVMTRPKV